MTTRLVTLAGMLMLLPKGAQAYVDPGVVAVLYQLGYLALFALATTFILRPWAYLKSLVRRARGLEEPPPLENKEDATDG